MSTTLIRRSLLGLAIVVGLVVAAELGFRVLDFVRPSYAQQIILAVGNSDGDWSVPDDDLGMLARPSRSDTFENRDFSYLLESDRFGFANREPWPRMPNIVFLGDSLIVGRGVGIDGQFTTLVDEALSDRSVLNLGLPGASPEHLLRLFRRFTEGMRPDVVIACLWLAADIENAKQFDAWPDVGRQWDYEEFRRDHWSRLRQDRSLGLVVRDPAERRSPPSALQRLLRRSALLSELSYLAQPDGTYSVHWPDGSETYFSERKLEYLKAGYEQNYPELDSVFFGPLVELRRLVEERGATFAVALIPSKEEIAGREAHPDILNLVSDVRERLAERQLTVIDLYAPVAAAAESTSPFYPYDIHLNAIGNRAVADALVAWLEQTAFANVSRDP